MLSKKKKKPETTSDTGEKTIRELKDIKEVLNRIEVTLDNIWRERIPGGE